MANLKVERVDHDRIQNICWTMITTTFPLEYILSSSFSLSIVNTLLLFAVLKINKKDNNKTVKGDNLPHTKLYQLPKSFPNLFRKTLLLFIIYLRIYIAIIFRDGKKTR